MAGRFSLWVAPPGAASRNQTTVTCWKNSRETTHNSKINHTWRHTSKWNNMISNTKNITRGIFCVTFKRCLKWRQPPVIERKLHKTEDSVTSHILCQRLTSFNNSVYVHNTKMSTNVPYLKQCRLYGSQHPQQLISLKKQIVQGLCRPK